MLRQLQCAIHKVRSCFEPDRKARQYREPPAISGDVPWSNFDDSQELGESASTYSEHEQNPNRPILEHGVDSGIFDVLILPVSNVGFAGVFDVNGDGVSLLARTIDASGNVIESS